MQRLCECVCVCVSGAQDWNRGRKTVYMTGALGSGDWVSES